MVLAKTLAVFLLVLVALSRFLFFIYPTDAKKFIRKFTNAHVDGLRYLAIILFIIAIGAFYVLLIEISLVQLVAAVFAGAFLLSSWFLWHHEFLHAIINQFVKKEDGWVRVHAGLSMLIALILLYFVLGLKI